MILIGGGVGDTAPPNLLPEIASFILRRVASNSRRPRERRHDRWDHPQADQGRASCQEPIERRTFPTRVDPCRFSRVFVRDFDHSRRALVNTPDNGSHTAYEHEHGELERDFPQRVHGALFVGDDRTDEPNNLFALVGADPSIGEDDAVNGVLSAWPFEHDTYFVVRQRQCEHLDGSVWR